MGRLLVFFALVLAVTAQLPARAPARSSSSARVSKPPSVKVSKAPKYHPPKSTIPKTSHTATATTKRSSAAKSAFERSTPCPATGKKSGSCKGYVVDHIKPLACGGADAPSNMQWQTAEAAKRKDTTERSGCR